MKVRITLTVEVNEAAWNLTYGPNVPVRIDVHSYVLELVQNCAAAAEGCITAVRNES